MTWPDAISVGRRPACSWSSRLPLPARSAGNASDCRTLICRQSGGTRRTVFQATRAATLLLLGWCGRSRLADGLAHHVERDLGEVLAWVRSLGVHPRSLADQVRFDVGP